MKIIIIFLLLVISGNYQIQDGIWQQYSSADCHFSVLFPGTPQEFTQPENSEAGVTKNKVYAASSGGKIYAVICTEFFLADIDKALPEDILKGAKDQMVAELGGKLTSDSAIKIGGNSAREITFELPNNIIVQGRLILTKNTLFFISVRSSKEDQNLPSVNKFLDSFQLAANKE